MKINGKAVGEIALAVGITVVILLVAPSFLQPLGKLQYIGAFLVGLIGSATVIIPTTGFLLIAEMARDSTLNALFIGILAGIGSGIGEITGYLAGNGGARVLEGYKHVRFFKKQAEFVRKWEDVGIFFLALLPNPIFDFAGMAAGAFRMPWWRFLIACVAAKVIKFSLIAEFGLWSTGLF